MRLAICDDEVLQLDLLEMTIRECQVFKAEKLVIDRFSCGTDLIKSLRGGVQYNFIFLDIHMPEKSGLDTYAEIAISPNTKIIFVSTHVENLPEVFALRMPCFLYKPYNKDTFLRTVCTAIDNQSHEYLLVCVCDEKRHIIGSQQICYIEVLNHKLIVHADKEFSVVERSSLDEMSKLLEPYGFFRCHRSFLINFDYYIKHDAKNVYIADAKRILAIPLGRESKLKISGAILKYKTSGGLYE